MIKVYSPRFTAVIYKRIQRRAGIAGRYTQANRYLDLTPFLGEGCSIQTSKGLRDPAGAFSITLTDEADRRIGGVLDTLYAFIEPMDYVEIRGARQPETYTGGKLPIIMRGFVSAVNRAESMGADGRPARRVVISGQDYGKVPQMVIIFPRSDYAAGNAWLTSFPLLVKYGFDITLKSSYEFMSLVVNNILNPWLRAMTGVVQADPPGSIPLLGYDNQGTYGFVAPLGMQPFQGTIRNFITDWADTPWNEVFIEDREGGPYMVYRPTPFLDINGKLIQGGTIPRMDIDIGIEDVVRMDIGRTDADVSNYYWVEAPRSLLADTAVLNIDSLASGVLFDRTDPNCDPNLYGLRLMQVQTNHNGIGKTLAEVNQQRTATAVANTQIGMATQLPTDKPTEDRQAFLNDGIGWIAARRELLKAMNRDNAVFESGSMTVMGHEQLKVGRYLKVHRGTLTSQFYVTHVTQSWAPFGAYTTTLTLERGDGLIKRSAMTAPPKLAEGAKGPYS